MLTCEERGEKGRSQRAGRSGQGGEPMKGMRSQSPTVWLELGQSNYTGPSVHSVSSPHSVGKGNDSESLRGYTGFSWPVLVAETLLVEERNGFTWLWKGSRLVYRAFDCWLLYAGSLPSKPVRLKF